MKNSKVYKLTYEPIYKTGKSTTFKGNTKAP